MAAKPIESDCPLKTAFDSYLCTLVPFAPLSSFDQLAGAVFIAYMTGPLYVMYILSRQGVMTKVGSCQCVSVGDIVSNK